jgi:hypothetical protein
LDVLDDPRDIFVVFHHFLMVAATLVGGTCFYGIAHLDIDFNGFSLYAIRVKELSFLQ